VSGTTAKSGAISKEGHARELGGVGPLDLRALGFIEEDGAVNVTGLLSHLLGEKDTNGKSWIQRLAEGWIYDAVDGNPRATEDIFDRAEKGWAARATAPSAVPSIDDGTANAILEVLSGLGEDTAGD